MGTCVCVGGISPPDVSRCIDRHSNQQLLRNLHVQTVNIGSLFSVITALTGIKVMCGLQSWTVPFTLKKQLNFQRPDTILEEVVQCSEYLEQIARRTTAAQLHHNNDSGQVGVRRMQ